MQTSLPNYIVIEGPIGVGKSSLAQRLAKDFESELILEEIDENPFLEQFYQRPSEAALSTQLFFLMQRTKQIKQLRQGSIFAHSKIADYLIEKDQLFAQVTLTPTEYDLYLQVYEHLIIDAPKPDLVVYLQAPVATLLDRIKKRGRYYERFMEANYLEQLNEAYADYFYHYHDAPLLIVNASDIDFINNDRDYEQLKTQIINTTSGRHYFNPLPFVS
ncbi:MAG: deoxynucleoside kinase [Pseudomonadota bacterium]